MTRSICKCTQTVSYSPIRLGDYGVSDLLADHMAPVGLGEDPPGLFIILWHHRVPYKGKV